MYSTNLLLRIGNSLKKVVNIDSNKVRAFENMENLRGNFSKIAHLKTLVQELGY